MKTHQLNMNIKNCHYYNNSKVCPYEQYGCKFKHNESKNCRYGDKCNLTLCQFKHSPDSKRKSDTRKSFEGNKDDNLLADLDDNFSTPTEKSAGLNVAVDNNVAKIIPEIQTKTSKAEENYKKGSELYTVRIIVWWIIICMFMKRKIFPHTRVSRWLKLRMLKEICS